MTRRGPDIAELGARSFLSRLDERRPFPLRVADPGDPWGTWDLVPLEWFIERPPARQWLLRQPGLEEHGVFPLGKVGLLAAAGGAGKTMAITQLAVAVALPAEAHAHSPDRFAWFGGWQRNGGPVRGGFPVVTTGRVLLVLGEEDADEARRRIYRAMELYALNGYLGPEADAWRRTVRDRLVVVPAAGNPNLTLTELDPESGSHRFSVAADALLKRMQDTTEPWAAVLVDPFSRFAGADAEKDNRAATVLIQAFERLVEAPGNPAVLVAHHTSQASRQAGSLDATDARGVTAISDGIRWQSGMRPRPELRDAPRLVDFAVTKSNYALFPPPLVLARGDGGALTVATHDELEAYRTAQVAAAEEAGAKKAELDLAKKRGAQRAKEDGL